MTMGEGYIRTGAGGGGRKARLEQDRRARIEEWKAMKEPEPDPRVLATEISALKRRQALLEEALWEFARKFDDKSGHFYGLMAVVEGYLREP